MPMQAICEDASSTSRLTVAQVVHSTNKFGRKWAGEAGDPRVSAVFHSYPIDLHAFYDVAIF
jgi:hypothetical protein